MTTPTLPGTIPGLLRRTSPVIGPDGPSVIIGPSIDGRWYPLPGGELPSDALHLNLSDPTGRAHAAWWLASTLLPRERIVNATVMPGRTIGPVVYGLATLDVVNGNRWRRSDPSPFECTDHLDVYDPRLLPDGSRWVDAEALRLVCLHVAGSTPSPA